MAMKRNSTGLVRKQRFTFGGTENPMILESGLTLGPIDIVYETYGEPNADKSNAILICHALSGDAHVAGYHDPHDRQVGWWDAMVGPGKAFDTDRYWVVCSNIIGGCKGSTGPGSIDPVTGKPYGTTFPVITIGDMVEAQKRLIDHLGISRLLTVVGGSMGGFQVLEWALRFPEMVRSAMVIAASARLSALGLAFNTVGRHAIVSDPDWLGGNYYGTPGPVKGLSIARMIGHITYLSDAHMDVKFGRKFHSADRLSFDFTTEFAVESYLKYQGERFTERFDANSYLYISKAMDYFDIAGSYGNGSLDEALYQADAKFLVVSYSSDWLFATAQSRAMVQSLVHGGKDVSFVELNAPCGHDSFLMETGELTRLIVPFLRNVGKAGI